MNTVEQCLRNAIETIIAAAQKRGLGPEFPALTYSLQWMEPTGPMHWSGRRATRTAPSFYGIWKKIENDVRDSPELAELAKQAAALIPEDAPPQVSFFQDYGQRLLEEYCRQVGELRVDEGVIAEACQQLRQDLASRTLESCGIYQIQQFCADEPFRLSKEVSFRQIDDDDIEKYGCNSFHPDNPFCNPLAGFSFEQQLHRGGWFCEIHATSPKTDYIEWQEAIRRTIDDVTAALQLSCMGRARVELVTMYITSPYLRFGRTGGGFAFMTSRFGDVMTLSKDDIAHLQKTFHRVVEIRENDALADLRLPLRRIRSSAGRGDIEDHLVDCVIALENLLACDSPQMETTFRFRLRGAALLPETEFGSAQQRIKVMNDLYSFRSKTVHGNKHSGAKKTSNQEEYQKQLVGLSTTAERVLLVILRWFMDNGGGRSTEAILKDLDAEMVKGGQNWAIPGDPPGHGAGPAP